MSEPKKLPAAFYATLGGNEPVREWLKGLDEADRRTIGVDIATAEYGWPVGMPLCRSLGKGLFEVRSKRFEQGLRRVIGIIAVNPGIAAERLEYDLPVRIHHHVKH